jgi:ribosomal-protein-alanine N-acetyltransferase
VVAYAFDDVGLHRVEAACQPDNAPSKRVLEKVGFTLEGEAKAYLKINGAWRDHLLWGVHKPG